MGGETVWFSTLASTLGDKNGMVSPDVMKYRHNERLLCIVFLGSKDIGWLNYKQLTSYSMGLEEGWHDNPKAKRMRNFLQGVRIADNLMKGRNSPYENGAGMDDEPQNFTCGLCGKDSHEATITDIISQRVGRNRDDEPFSYDEKDTVSQTGWLICNDCGAGAHSKCISNRAKATITVNEWKCKKCHRRKTDQERRERLKLKSKKEKETSPTTQGNESNNIDYSES